ncbi:MAG: ABC transporter ATP-binding protein [Ginsengibacter sp.]
MPAIVIKNVTKTYLSTRDKIVALDDISLSVNKSELFGLVGPDGAGKTTLFRILTTLLLADNGSATVDDFDVKNDYKKIRERVGYMPGKFSLYQDLTVEENLNFFATIFNTTVKENYNLIKDIYLQIEPFKNRRAGKLSGGMKQKLALCCALIHKPSVLFLDEPTTGVDPVSRKEFWEMLKSLQKQNISIMVSTPYMDEADLCDRIAFIQEGKILSVDTPVNIKKNFRKELFAVKGKDMYKILLKLRDNDDVKTSYAFGDYHHVTMKRDRVKEEDIKSYLDKNLSNENIIVKKIQPTIEDSFMEYLHS